LVFWAWVKKDLGIRRDKMGPNQLKKNWKLVGFRRFLRDLKS
jgi:hypothetical protein